MANSCKCKEVPPPNSGAAAEAAVRIHATLLEEFGKKKHGPRSERHLANEVAEAVAAEKYAEMLDAFEALLPGIDAQKLPEEAAYSVWEMRGRSIGDETIAGPKLAMRLECLRSEGASGFARDAFCALLAALASRKEMCWLEAHDDEVPARGYFAHALACSRTTFRFTVAPTAAGPRPASLLLTTKLALRDALSNTDSGGPLKELPPDAWVGGDASKDFEFGLQELELSEELGEHGSLPEERAFAREVLPEPRIRELLMSGADVVALDAYTALAPRAVAASEGIRKVVQAELLQLMQRAKAEGRALVFQLGGANPHLLARKVYLRPAFSQYGLKCGYLRWRFNSKASWGREQPWVNRVCLGLQLP